MSETKNVITFEPIKTEFDREELLVLNYTVTGTENTTGDQIGVFPVENKSCLDPYVFQLVPQEVLNNSNNCISLSLEFVDDSKSYEIRYVTKHSNVLAKSGTFKIANALLRSSSTLLQIKNCAFDSDSDNIELEGTLAAEVKRRKQAEDSLELLAKRLKEKFDCSERNAEEITRLKNCVNHGQSKIKAIQEEYEELHEQSELIVSELEEIRAIATTYKIECTNLNLRIGENEETITNLKELVMEEQEQHQQDQIKLKAVAEEEIEKLADKVESLDEMLQNERSKVGDLVKTSEDLQKLHESESQQFATEKSKHDSEIEELTTKLSEEAKSRKELIDNYEKTISNLESRVVNESSNASRLSNEVTMAESRAREAVEDIKFFRQNFIDTEQKLQRSQSYLQKTLDELNNLKNNMKSNTSDVSVQKDDVHATSDVSASTSVVSVDVPSDVRRRAPGDVTDCTTDDESMSLAAPSVDSMVSTVSTVASEKPARIHPPSAKEERRLLEFPELPRAQHQQIPVLLRDDTTPKKGSKRRFGKPIDLSPTVAPAVPYDQARNDQQNNFSRDVSELDRSTLERQYQAIRQHRNSLIRENSLLNSKVTSLKHDVVVLNKTIENVALDAEMKIGMLQVMMGNHDYISMLTPAPTATSNFQQQNRPAGKSNGLSPYAKEYTPSNAQQQQAPKFTPLQQQQTIPSMFLPPPPPNFFEFMAQQMEGGGAAGLPTMTSPVPAHLPPTPKNLPPTPRVTFNDVTEQLAGMGINILNQ